MKIVLIVNDKPWNQEVEYIAKVFGSVLDADIRVQECQTPLPEGAVYIGYISSDEQHLLPAACRIRIKADIFFWERFIQGNEVKLVKRRTDIFPIMQSSDKEPVIVRNQLGITTSLDIIVSSFWLLSRYEECFETEELDEHKRFKFSHSALGSDLNKSIIHLYLNQLIQWIKEQYGVGVQFRSNNLEAVISHDIDIPYYFGTIRSVVSRARYLLKENGGECAKHLMDYLKVRAGIGKDKYETFDYIMETQASRGIKSTWFILLCGDNHWGLDLKKYGQRLKRITAAGHEIALHPGYDSFLNLEKRSAEKKAIEELSDCAILGARNHFLRFQVPESYQVCHDSGLVYDSTLGFAEREGFRAGFCSPFKPYHLGQRCIVDVLEIPMSIMDGTFRDYQHLPPQEAEIRIKAMIDHVADLRGTIVFNWHNTFLLAEESGWRSVYENSLDYLVEKNAVFYRADQLARKWSERWQ